MIWPFAPPDCSVWQHGQAPPPHFLQKAQTALRLFAPLFFLDSLLQNLLSNNGEFCKRLSGFICETIHRQAASAENRKSLHFGVKWPMCRGPPPV